MQVVALPAPIIAPSFGRVLLFAVVLRHVWSRWIAPRAGGAGRGTCGSSVGRTPGRQLLCPLAQVVQVAAQLVEGKADAEQASDLVGRERTRHAFPPYPVEGGPVAADGFGQGVGPPRRKPFGHGPAEVLEVAGARPGRVPPRLGERVARGFVPGASGGSPQHDRVVTQPREGAEQRGGVRPLRRAAPPLPRRFPQEALELGQALAGGRGEGAEVRWGGPVGDGQGLELPGQQPRDAGGDVQQRAGGSGWYDQNGGQ